MSKPAGSSRLLLVQVAEKTNASPASPIVESTSGQDAKGGALAGVDVTHHSYSYLLGKLDGGWR
jgi:hypothetical protein